jgi:hypothetical protein
MNKVTEKNEAHNLYQITVSVNVTIFKLLNISG